ncbi:pullulanase-type alpha-1,6-glucosidase [Thalassotalea agarivorans]|uniref:Alpha-1,6-glucosidases, pullulanase-type n=1 Tax=Thalassotalea agarivorans TaxID=349064 RepID=A0A1I0BUJ9_THASX|nr:pullulanase-type alpha-1,6-glucosidase [Thalassotalea agarivorans]SET10738.1 alpha-1,6-glucosidases, pullulanase-type [Thalassotalea agarivorans]
MKRSLTLITASLLAACSDAPVNNSLSPSEYSAHWISQDTLLVPSDQGENLTLVAQDQRIVFTRETDAIVDSNYPHLSAFSVYKANITDDAAKAALKTALVITNESQDYVSKVQKAGVIDLLYTAGENDANEYNQFGAMVKQDAVSFALWAPTAQSVKVKLYNKDKSLKHTQQLEEDAATGIWHLDTNQAVATDFYRYEVTTYHPQTHKVEVIDVTDPYSISLSTNSEFSQIVDLSSAQLKPEGWDNHVVPGINDPLDNIFYELHIRDFSASDKTQPAADQGKYAAFSNSETDGVKHITMLKEAGINTIHLLPAFDIGTVNEEPTQQFDQQSSISEICAIVPDFSLCDSDIDKQQSLQQVLVSAPSDTFAQDIVSQLRAHDKYNWGYDPFHYNVPEGSYAKDSDGYSRIIEFRQMVQTIHEMGMRVVMDVVYNHTHAAGLATNSVLDKVVPGYYHRLNPLTGAIEQSTCCDNTATEHAMMDKLMSDSLALWTEQYKIDGYRFDLMGHQPKAAMLAARDRVHAIDPDNYFYGEGWDFGEVAKDAIFEQASQSNLGGTDIGTFTDRLRDAVRGGAFNAQGEDIRKSQGIGSGLMHMENELIATDTRAKYDEYQDIIKLGLAANLKQFSFTSAQGNKVKGTDVPYGGTIAAYALKPADTINYVSKHDNQTLWDNNQYRLPYDTTTKQRVRIQAQNLSYPLLAQGIPFIHMGSELLRSKSFLRDSYDYSDWFNKVDFSYNTNNYNVGLPPAEKDEANWAIIRTLLEQNDGRDHVTKEDIVFSRDVFLDFVRVRMSSKLFRLNTAEQIVEKVDFIEGNNNVIAMRLSDSGEAQIDPTIDEIIVIFNPRTQPQRVSVEQAKAFELHPVQQAGSDDVVKQSKLLDAAIEVPALTTAVFVRKAS